MFFYKQHEIYNCKNFKYEFKNTYKNYETIHHWSLKRTTKFKYSL